MTTTVSRNHLPRKPPLTPVAQRIIQIASRGLQRRCQPKRQRRQHCNTERERQHRRIQFDHRLGWNQVLRHRRDKEFQSSPGDEYPQHRSGNRKYQALDHQQAH
jgi:hypothetical protein